VSEGPDLRPAGRQATTSASSSDVRPVGWVTDQPGVTVRRQRRPGLLVLGVALVAGGAVALALSIFTAVRDAGPDPDDVVADGRVAALDGSPTEPARFTAGGADPFTVWIEIDDLNDANDDTIVASTACTADLTGEETADFQGNRQGNAITVDDQSTVGWFTAAEGTVEVACEHVPFGRIGRRGLLRDEHDFTVVAGKPAALTSVFVLMPAGILALITGIFVLARWAPGRIRRV
jgi:hypothetical protein